jgi:calcineurin-like phosphoesterase family protein
MAKNLKYPSKTYFTADPHFGHDAIRCFCNRPFATVEEMDEALIKNWNDTVQSGSTVYIIGDFAYKNHADYLKRLNGKKILIEGNHDKMNVAVKKMFTEHHAFLRRRFFGNEVTLCHYALSTWANNFYGAWHLYGHSHGRIKEFDHIKCLDVGVDVWNYKPVPYEVIEHIMNKKSGHAVKTQEHERNIADNALNHLTDWQEYEANNNKSK